MTTIEKVESYLLLTVDENFRDEVQAWIDAVTAYIERYTGRTFTTDSTATDRLYDGNNDDALFIDDAFQVTQVKIGTEVLLTTDYFIYPTRTLPKTRIVLPYRIFTYGNSNITVTAKWGYGSVPEDLSFAATVMVAGIINNSNDHQGEVLSETIGRYSVTYKSGTTQETDFAHAKDILKMYKRFL